MTFKDKNVLIVGMALSGASSAILLDKLGAHLILHDAKPLDALPEDTKDAVSVLQYEDYLGRDPGGILDTVDLAVVSPGVPPTLSLLSQLHERKIPVLAEIELGYQTMHGDLIAVTGTNGKTTTTALTGAIFEDAGRTTHVLGNIGLPLTARSLATRDGDAVVVETAALQLDDTVEYRPRACAVLNVTPDHLDRYGTMENYAAAKARVFRNQTADDCCVLNYDDPIVRGFSSAVPSRVLWISLEGQDLDGVFAEDGYIVSRRGGRAERILPTGEVRLPGRHNLQNALAAAALALDNGVPAELIAGTLRTFAGVEHRIETVCETDDVVYINDSKGTNPDATQKAIEAMTRPTVLILGGFDKHASFQALFEAMGDPVRHIVVLGATADKIMSAAAACGWDAIERAETFEDAVRRASKRANPGDAVLLSPACASWDMFANFEERGRRFKEIVRSF